MFRVGALEPLQVLIHCPLPINQLAILTKSYKIRRTIVMFKGEDFLVAVMEIKGVKVCRKFTRRSVLWGNNNIHIYVISYLANFIDLFDPFNTFDLCFRYSPEQMYAVVAAVDMYQDFLPWCRRSDIVQRHSDGSFDAELEIGFQFLVESYVSHVKLIKPRLIKVTAFYELFFSFFF